MLTNNNEKKLLIPDQPKPNYAGPLIQPTMCKYVSYYLNHKDIQTLARTCRTFFCDKSLRESIRQKISNHKDRIRIATEAGSTFIYYKRQLYACGKNTAGKLGLGNNDDQVTLQPVTSFPDNEQPAQFAIGAKHTLILCESGKVYACGDNQKGQLGLNSVIYYTFQLLPLQKKVDKVIVPPAIIYPYSLLLCEDGTVYGMGSNDCGQLGLKTGYKKRTYEPQPILFDGREMKAKNIFAAPGFGVIISMDGLIYGFGTNGSGQLGLGDTVNRPTPQILAELPQGKKIKQIITHSDFYDSVFFLYEDGLLYACGRNNQGALGIPNRVNQDILVPTHVQLNKIYRVSLASTHSLFLCADRSLYACGSAWEAHRCAGSSSYSSPTLQVLPDAEEVPKQVFAGKYMSLVLCESGKAYTSKGSSWQPLILPPDERIHKIKVEKNLLYATILCKSGVMYTLRRSPPTQNDCENFKVKRLDVPFTKPLPESSTQEEPTRTHLNF